MLYLIPTPIGNLKDITLRALDILKSCDYLLCEDTRRTRILLQKYEIDKLLKSFHKFNEKREEERVIQDLREGKKIGLVSDAGTPLICDPGALLIRRCQEENLPYTCLPGPCSVIVALSMSALLFEKFQFCGFLPKKKGDLKKALEEALYYSGVSLFFESPERLVKTLECIENLNPRARVAIARELSKIHEECRLGNSSDVKEHYVQNPPRGEIVLIIEGGLKKEEKEDKDAIELYQYFLKEEKLSPKEALKKVAKLKNIDKKELYKEIHQL